MSRVVGQNSLALCDEQNSLTPSSTPKGNDNLNFRLARDQVVLLEGEFEDALAAARIAKPLLPLL